MNLLSDIRQKLDFNIFEGIVAKGVPSHTISQSGVAWANGKLDTVRGSGRYEIHGRIGGARCIVAVW